VHDIRTYFFSSAPAAHSSRNTHRSDGLFGRERFRRFLLGDGVAAPRTTCLPLVPLALEFRWRFLVKGVGERDSGDFDGELVHSSMPRVKRLSLHGKVKRTRKKETRLVHSTFAIFPTFKI
jgi:hypothetical protein